MRRFSFGLFKKIDNQNLFSIFTESITIPKSALNGRVKGYVTYFVRSLRKRIRFKNMK